MNTLKTILLIVLLLCLRAAQILSTLCALLTAPDHFYRVSAAALNWISQQLQEPKTPQ